MSARVHLVRRCLSNTQVIAQHSLSQAGTIPDDTVAVPDKIL